VHDKLVLRSTFKLSLSLFLSLLLRYVCSFRSTTCLAANDHFRSFAISVCLHFRSIRRRVLLALFAHCSLHRPLSSTFDLFVPSSSHSSDLVLCVRSSLKVTNSQRERKRERLVCLYRQARLNPSPKSPLHLFKHFRSSHFFLLFLLVSSTFLVILRLALIAFTCQLHHISSLLFLSLSLSLLELIEWIVIV
jgi:hypothetical protein